MSCGPPETDRSTPAILGKEYPYQLYTHCGVRAAAFDEGRWWRANPPLDDGWGNPPAGWGNPFTRGVMVCKEKTWQCSPHSRARWLSLSHGRPA